MRETTDAMHPTHPRRRPWPTVLLLVVTALLLALFAVVLIAPPAGAHALGGVPGPSPLPWLAGAALPAMAVVAAARPRRSGNPDDPDLPGGA